ARDHAATLRIERPRRRADAPEHRPVIDPEPDRPLLAPRQIAGQPPADTDIPKVIHNPAEDFPARPGIFGQRHHFGEQSWEERLESMWTSGQIRKPEKSIDISRTRDE